jgi:hypothetical protein
MRRRSFRVSIATVLALGGVCAAALAFVSGSNAGSTGASLKLFSQPSVVTVNGSGFIKASFRAASGSQTGSATHVMITVKLNSALFFDRSDSSPNCALTGTANDVLCTINSVSPGETVKRYVVFTAPSTGSYTTDGSVSWDNGSNGAGGGGAANGVPQPADAPLPTTTVYSATNSSHAGNCFLSGSGTVSTPPVSSKDNQQTSAEVGAAASFLGLPCPFAEVGEDPAPAGFDTDISHDTIPQLSQPAKITLTRNSLPIKFEDFSWRFLPDYPATVPSQTIPSCDKGQLPANAIVCLLSSAKKGSGGTWTFLQQGTGDDPAYGH